MAYPSLADMGTRIVVMGPSNAGKSTLAVAIGDALRIEPVHLDQMRHLPDTDWQVRPDNEFKALHDEAILEDSWVMEGNYTRLLPQRLARATGAIVLDTNRWLRLGRYLRRTLFEKHRAGTLAGNKDSLKWQMVDWIMVRSIASAARSRGIISATALPRVFCYTARDLDALYAQWGLTRAGHFHARRPGTQV